MPEDCTFTRIDGLPPTSGGVDPNPPGFLWNVYFGSDISGLILWSRSRGRAFTNQPPTPPDGGETFFVMQETGSASPELHLLSNGGSVVGKFLTIDVWLNQVQQELVREPLDDVTVQVWTFAPIAVSQGDILQFQFEGDDGSGGAAAVFNQSGFLTVEF